MVFNFKKIVYFLKFLLVIQGIMLVYDITSEKSFDNIKNWIRNIEEVGFDIDSIDFLDCFRFVSMHQLKSNEC